MKTTENHSITLTAGTIYYYEQGSGRPILFLHGVIANGALWQPVLDQMNSNVRCIAPDWPLGAHAEPMHPDADLSIDGMIRLVVEFIDRMELEDVVLVGNDSGGALLQMIAARHPEKIGGFVLTPCDAYETFPPFWFSYLKWLGMTPRLCRLVARSMLALPVLQRSPNAFGGLIDRPFRTDETSPWLRPMAGSLAITRDMCQFLRSCDPRQTLEAARRLGETSLPGLLLWSRHNPFFKYTLAQRLENDLPNARLETIDGKSTFIAMDHPEWVAEHIQGFLAAKGTDCPSTLQETSLKPAS